MLTLCLWLFQNKFTMLLYILGFRSIKINKVRTTLVMIWMRLNPYIIRKITDQGTLNVSKIESKLSGKFIKSRKCQIYLNLTESLTCLKGHVNSPKRLCALFLLFWNGSLVEGSVLIGCCFSTTRNSLNAFRVRMGL